MKLHFPAYAMVASLLLVGSPAAQEPPEFPTASREHQLLEKFAGEWETESTGSMGPDQPPVKMKGTINGEMLGSFWVISHFEGNVMGMDFRAVQTIGYDPAKQKYVGTWVDSMMGHLWKYEGTLDETGKILTLEAEGPNHMEAGKITKFRDSYEFKSPDHIVARSAMLGDDGAWVTFMTGHSRRKK